MKLRPASVVRQSPALVVAMLALFVALTGTAVATTSALITGKNIKNGSITGADVKNKSLTGADIRGQLRGPRGLQGPPGAAGAKGDKGDKGEKGDPGQAGAPATALWAVVDGNAAATPTNVPITRGSGVVGTTTTTHNFAGEYRIQFNRDVSGCAYLAGVGQVGNSGQGFGFATAQGTTIGGGNAAVFVQTFDQGGVEVDREFHLAVFC